MCEEFFGRGDALVEPSGVPGDLAAGPKQSFEILRGPPVGLLECALHQAVGPLEVAEIAFGHGQQDRDRVSVRSNGGVVDQLTQFVDYRGREKLGERQVHCSDGAGGAVPRTVVDVCGESRQVVAHGEAAVDVTLEEVSERTQPPGLERRVVLPVARGAPDDRGHVAAPTIVTDDHVDGRQDDTGLRHRDAVLLADLDGSTRVVHRPGDVVQLGFGRSTGDEQRNPLLGVEVGPEGLDGRVGDLQELARLPRFEREAGTHQLSVDRVGARGRFVAGEPGHQGLGRVEITELEPRQTPRGGWWTTAPCRVRCRRRA